MHDVVIIGGGVIGCSIARELSRYTLDIVVLEKGEDISTGATKANSGIIHGGYDAAHNKSKGYFSRKGNQMFDRLEEELNFGFSRCGSLVLAFSQEEREHLKKIIENGLKNGVDDLKIIEREELREIEPNISSEALCALHCPSAGITSPYEYCIALMENAIENGVDLQLNAEVKSIMRSEEFFTLKTTKETYRARYVINCAGVNSDEVSSMIGIDDFHIIPRRGEYLIFQRGTGQALNRVIFQCPTKEGKGILVTPTYHNNLMIGPNAQEVDRKDDVDTTKEVLATIIKTGRKSLPDFDTNKIIRSFAGIRATSSTGDFIIGKTTVKNFINCAGIDSPGLTSSPAIALHVVKLLEEESELIKDEDFNPFRERVAVKLNDENTLSMKEVLPLTDLPLGDGERVVCRCEQVREKTIRKALDRGITVDSTDGIKRRTRAGMGVCQGTFCTPRVREIIADHYNISPEEVSERGKISSDLLQRVKRGEVK